jgi:hypothetical protein
LPLLQSSLAIFLLLAHTVPVFLTSFIPFPILPHALHIFTGCHALFLLLPLTVNTSLSIILSLPLHSHTDSKERRIQMFMSEIVAGRTHEKH